MTCDVRSIPVVLQLLLTIGQCEELLEPRVVFVEIG